MRTNVEGIWAAGDVTAVDRSSRRWRSTRRESRSTTCSAGMRHADYSVLPTAIFTDPELAQVGLTEEEAREQGFEPDTVRHELRDVQRASYTDTKRGLFKLVYDGPSRRLLGVQVVARGGSDIVQGLGVAMRLGATVDDLAHAHHAFPTLGGGDQGGSGKGGVGESLERHKPKETTFAFHAVGPATVCAWSDDQGQSCVLSRSRSSSHLRPQRLS